MSVSGIGPTLLTVADLLTMMGVLGNELDIVSGGVDETRAINALNMATDFLEGVASSMGKVLSSSNVASGQPNLKTVTSTESSPIPTALLRIDRLWAIDPSTRLPIFPLKRIQGVGDHTPALPWPLNYVVSPSNGQPRAYYPDGDTLYWLPIPDAVYEVRAYGLWARPLYADRKSAFLFPDSCALPLAAFATRYLYVAVNDSTEELQRVANEAFGPALKGLMRRDRSAPVSKHYEYVHAT